MRQFISIFCIYILAILSEYAAAQDINRYAEVKPIPSWVKNFDAPTYDKTAYQAMDSYYETVDWQTKITTKDGSYFGRFRNVLLSPQGVEDNSNIQISFDPEYETIDLHYVRVLRGGKIIDKTDLSEFSIYRKETDRDKLLYNGTLEISYIVPDIRVGDTLEYAFSTNGKNPAVGFHYILGYRQEYNDVVIQLLERALIAEDLPSHGQAKSGALEPEITKIGSFKEYFWDLSIPKAIPVDDNLPAWYFSSPTYQISSVNSWQDIGRYFSKYYKPPSRLPAALELVKSEIENAHDDDKARSRAALDYVQRNIRYLGIEIGKGGYIPRSPELVMKRRFGDCKDMTLLLVSLLQAMNIEAKPLLVNADERSGFINGIPQYAAFDHVVVRVKIGDDIYILDPTRGVQLGDLDHLQQGFFEKGVLIAPDSPGVVEATVPMPDYYEDFKEVYELVSEDSVISMRSSSTYYQGMADRMQSRVSSDGLPALEKAFLEFYQNRYPSIEQVGDMRVEVDENKAIVSILVDYKITKGWEFDADEGSEAMAFYASETDNNIPDFDGSDRTAPFKISYPVKSRQILEFHVNENWQFNEIDIAHDTDAFAYKKMSKFEDNIYREVYEYRSLQDHITPEKFSDTMTVLSDIDDELGVYLTNGKGAESEAFSKEDMLIILMGVWLFLAALMSWIIAASLPWETEEELAAQTFYPVALPKFIILSLVSVGIYQCYWVFKNWRWVKFHQKEKVSPILRTIFMGITNFSLFSRLAGLEDKTGYGWFKTAAIPLAMIYFISSVIGSVLDSFSEAPKWVLLTTLIPILAVIPAASQVLKLNEDRPDIIVRNSKFGWPAILFIIGWMPLLLLFLWGQI